MALGLGTSIRTLDVLDDSAYKATHSFNFDGSDDYINLGNSWGLKQRATDTSAGVGISGAVWFKLDNVQTTGTTQNFINCIQYPGGWKMSYENTRLTLHMNIGGATRSAALTFSSGWRTLGTSANPLRASNWHHMGMTFDGRYLRLYLNGSLYGTTDAGSDDNFIHHDSGSPGTDTATQPACRDINDADLLIGADPGPVTTDGSSCGISGTSSGFAPYSGYINEIAIYNKVLTEACFSEIFEAVNTSGSQLDLLQDHGNYTNSGDLVALYRGNDVDDTKAYNAANPGVYDGDMKNSLALIEQAPS